MKYYSTKFIRLVATTVGLSVAKAFFQNTTCNAVADIVAVVVLHHLAKYAAGICNSGTVFLKSIYI